MLPLCLHCGQLDSAQEEVDGAATGAATTVFANGFESGNLDGHLLHLNGGRVTVAGSPVASGQYSGKYDLIRDPNADNFRAETHLPNESGRFQFNQEYWLGLSYFYADWERDSDAEGAPFQLHRAPSSWAEGCGGQVSAYSNAPFMMVSKDDLAQVITFHGVVSSSTPIVKGRWQRVIFHFKITWDESGYVEAWRDGTKLFRRDGKLHERYDDCGGEFQAPFFKMGIYKWNWKRGGQFRSQSSRRTLYIDDLKIARGPGGYELVSAPLPGQGRGDSSAPSAPTNLSATVISSTQINLAWTASNDNVGVVGYRVLRDGVQVATVSGTSYRDAGLTANTTYSYTVSAADAAGNISPPSARRTATTQVGSGGAGGLVAAYGFNEATGTTARDGSGRGHNLTPANGLGYRGSAPNTVLVFDGVDDYAEAASSAALNVANSRITLAAWLNFADTGDHQVFLAKPTAAATHARPYFAYALQGVYVSPTELRPRFWLTLGGSGQMVASNTTISPGWHFLAGTYDGARMRIYVDGVERGATAATGSISSYATPLRLGTNGGRTENFKGSMDNVRVYDRALSAAEIEGIMPIALP